MRFKLSTIFVLLVLAGSLAGLISATSNVERKWKTSALMYESPSVPIFFADRNKPFTIHFGVSGPTVGYTNGRSMYTQNHRFGWENCRRHFYNQTEWKTGPQIQESFDLNDDWWYEHCFYAQRDGYQQCRKQIYKLLQRQPEIMLRNKLVYSKRSLIFPACCCIIALVLLDKTRRRTSNRNITN